MTSPRRHDVQHREPAVVPVRHTRRYRRAARRAALAIGALLLAFVSATAVAPSASAVSGWSGKDPYHDYGGGACAWDSVYLDETYVYDQGGLVGYGYLRYSRSCKTNWSEFWYASGGWAYGYHTVEPWAWEAGKTGTDQPSHNLNDTGPVYSMMVDGRGTACAGAHLYSYPSHTWITWYT